MKRKHNLKRLLALLLCTVVFLGALPLSPLAQQRAGASSWAKPYVDQLREWGVLKGDGSGTINPGERLTRARMVAMLNRAFGFRTTGPIPFTDVKRQDWFYDDICIGYTEGVFNGESPTKANPNGLVTREQALTLMGRCMRLEENVGEVTEFTDGREFSSWSAPFARSAVLNNLINGFADGSFRPKGNITVGEMAKMLSIGIGNLINTPGVYPVGGYPPNGVFGNLTINTNNVTLRDVTIAGDLFLTGGVGLGGVVLDNVRVLGRIIIAGGGNSESAEASIILNNVEGHKLIIDPATGQFVSVRAVGGTNIPETQVSCNAYIQDDVRDNQKGLQKVYLEAQPGANFVIAGNMKDVYNKTPESTLTVGDTGTGSVSSITVDEEAKDSVLDLEINAVVDQVHLDTSAQVTGKGDIGQLNVNEDGSVSEILPDKVVVRPGVITEIAGIPDVDSEKAKEISSDPNILSGYPKVRNIAPTSADGVFSVNKAGTLYWALTNAAIGPLGDRDAEAMIHPSYGSGFMQFDNIEVPLSKTEHQVTFSGLDQGGTYYISAVLVDAHGRRSPVKSQEFTTPDGSVPAMSAGFPTIADRTPTRNNTNADTPYFELVDVQATVMATKTCDLYYVLLPAGSTQPQPSEFLSHSFPDPFGYGRVRMIKNAMDSFRINEIDMNLDGMPESLGELEESTSYDLYLWLTDSDGTQSSSIIKQTITTKDITPPKFNMETVQTATQATSVQLTNSINETGTVYWVAVDRGADYPVRRAGDDYEVDGVDMFLYSDYAKLQVVNGLNGLFAGKVAAQANKEFKLTISGLQPESAYDVYYLAADATGNYSDPIQVFTVHTLDETPPVARQEFEEYPEDSPNTPYADSTIRIIFNEDIIYRQPTNSTDPKVTDPVLLSMYQTAYGNLPGVTQEEQERAQRDLYNALKDMIILLDGSGRPVPVYDPKTGGDKTGDNAVDWVVDYKKVQVYLEGAELVVCFPTNTEHPEESSLNLQSGARYQFQLQNIADNSERHNVMGRQTLPIFETVSAQVVIDQFEGSTKLNAYTNGQTTGTPIYSKGDDDEYTTEIPIDIAFTARPRSTGSTADGVYWDMLFWFDTSVQFELYTRVQGQVEDPWILVGNVTTNDAGLTVADANTGSIPISVPDRATNLRGASVMRYLGNSEYHYINEEYKTGGIGCGLNDSSDQTYEYALHFTRIGNNEDRSTFSQLIKGQVTFVTGPASSLSVLSRSLNSDTAFDRVLNHQDGVREITFPKALDDMPRLLTNQFSDGKAPQLQNETPTFTVSDNSASMELALDRPGTVYYVLAPFNKDDAGNDTTAVLAPREGNNINVSEEKMKRIADSGKGVYTEDGKYGADEVLKGKEDGGLPNGHTLNTSTDEKIDNYKFVYPNSLNIMNPAGTGLTGSMIITDSAEVGIDNTSVPLDDLNPDTKYLVYIVTQGNSDILSEVKVFQFRTSPVTRPVISLRSSGSNITISSNIDANIDYMVVPYSTAMNEILQQEFVPDPSIIPAPAPLPSPDNKIYHAMGKNVPQGTKSAGSWFDVYADQATKDSIADYIRTTEADGSAVMGTGTIFVKGEGSETVFCSKDFELRPGIDYMFLAVGRSPENSGDAFRATFPFRMADSDAPVIDSVQNTLYAFKVENDFTKQWYIGGTLTLTFNEPLCYLQSGSGTQQTLFKVTNSKGSTNAEYKKTTDIVENLLAAGVQIIMDSSTADPPAQAVSIAIGFSMDNQYHPIDPTTGTVSIFNLTPSGSSVVFFPGLSDESYNARMDNPLSVSVTVRDNGDGTGTPVVNIPTAWMRAGLDPNVRS